MRAVVLIALAGLGQAGPPSLHKELHVARPERLDLEQVNTGSTAAAPEPHFTEETMPKVSPTLQCVMGLTMQYFIIYTCLAIIRTVNEFDAFAFIGIQKILETAYDAAAGQLF